MLKLGILAQVLIFAWKIRSKPEDDKDAGDIA
jgi:hypothetical protein